MAGEYIIVKQNQYMRRYRKAGATDPGHARTPADLGMRESGIFRRMVDRGVFVATGGGAYYMDLDSAREFVIARRKRALFVLAAVVIVLLALFLFYPGLFK